LVASALRNSKQLRNGTVDVSTKTWELHSDPLKCLKWFFLLFILFEAMICGYIRNQGKVDEKLEQKKLSQSVAAFRVAQEGRGLFWEPGKAL